MRSLFCKCKCHLGEKIFCSCFRPCCHQPHVPQDQQTAMSKTSSIPVKLVRVALPIAERHA
jgi:hypothetical protein